MEEKSTFWKSAMIYGLYIGIIATLYSVVLYVVGQTQNKGLLSVMYLFYIVGIVLAQINYRNRDLNGNISYGQAVGFGTAVMLFGGIISALYTLIIFKIDPGLIEQIKTIQEEALLQKGLSEDQIEAAMSITSKMLTPGIMAISGLFGAVIIGTIISLITSIFVKKQPSEDAFDEAMEDVKTEE
jgi:vacuolar-type H+-ATPase subunit I/STV1